MKRYALSHLSDELLLRSLAAVVALERTVTADVLAHIAEVDERKLYLPAGYPSMFAYCVGELRLSEDAAFRRITAARAARRFPAILEALAEGRLHLAGVNLLAPRLTEDTAEELLSAAAGKTKAQIERLLAERFPQSDLLAWVEVIPAPSPVRSGAQLVPGRVEPRHAHSRVAPLSAQSYAVQLTMSAGTYDKLRRAGELLGHRVPSGDLAAVLDRALDLAIPLLEKQKFAATSKPGARRRHPSGNPRHIPAHVMRAVWARDGGQCTYVGETGHRCESRKRLEFDHALEVARGGEATVEGIRLRCRAHNQYTAECTFGAEFMRHRRIAVAEARAAAKAAGVKTTSPEQTDDRDVVPWLRALGFSTAEARHAAARCDDMPDATLEQRVRAALTSFRVRGARVVRAQDSEEIPVSGAEAHAG